MKVLTVKQPWAWLIVQGFKDIENRTWVTNYRGPLLIQASAHRSSKRYTAEVHEFARARGVELPETFEQGGIVGIVELIDCVREHQSPWFEGPVGWVLENARELPFVPCCGRLGLFAPPESVLDYLPDHLKESSTSGSSSRSPVDEFD